MARIHADLLFGWTVMIRASSRHPRFDSFVAAGRHRSTPLRLDFFPNSGM
jgi:hypothetical protein